jgi:hypothetical protein
LKKNQMQQSYTLLGSVVRLTHFPGLENEGGTVLFTSLASRLDTGPADERKEAKEESKANQPASKYDNRIERRHPGVAFFQCIRSKKIAPAFSARAINIIQSGF